MCGLAAVAFAQGTAVTGQVDIVRENGSASDTGGGVVVWLTPIPNVSAVATGGNQATMPQIVQRNKRFETPLLAVQVGTVVDFPNLDPFFHNVFSLFDGKRFDLGLYEAGATRSIRFDRPGVCYIFCNIHSEMSATVIVVDSPYFAVLDTPGEFRIASVPRGRYLLNVWAEGASPEALTAATREITVGREPAVAGTIDLEASQELIGTHSNKYGQEYDPPLFSSPIYTLP